MSEAEHVLLLSGPAYQLEVLRELLAEQGIDATCARQQGPHTARRVTGHEYMEKFSAAYGIASTSDYAELLVVPADLDGAHAVLEALPPDALATDELPDEVEPVLDDEGADWEDRSLDDRTLSWIAEAQLVYFAIGIGVAIFALLQTC